MLTYKIESYNSIIIRNDAMSQEIVNLYLKISFNDA